jgi:hypothetical protein
MITGGLLNLVDQFESGNYRRVDLQIKTFVNNERIVYRTIRHRVNKKMLEEDVEHAMCRLILFTLMNTFKNHGAELQVL